MREETNQVALKVYKSEFKAVFVNLLKCEFKGYDKCPDKEVHHSKYKQHSKGNSQANLSYRSLAVIEKPSIEKQYNIIL